jgi:hypothetical protein
MIPLTTLSIPLADTPRLIEPDRLPNPIPAGAAQLESPDLLLRGYRLDNPHVQPGDMLSLTLHWQVRQQPQQNYGLHFYLAAENALETPLYLWPVVEPIGGEWPTSQWPAGYWVQDKVDLPVGADIPPGRYKLGVALKVPVTGPAAASQPELLGVTHFTLDSVSISP